MGFWTLQGSHVYVEGSPKALRLKAKFGICVFMGITLKGPTTLYLRFNEISKMATTNGTRPIDMNAVLGQEPLHQVLEKLTVKIPPSWLFSRDKHFRLIFTVHV